MSSNGRRGSTVSLELNEEEEDDDDEETMVGSSGTSSGQSQSGKKGNPKKPETEEEKRRNFLERNRQGGHSLFSYMRIYAKNVRPPLQLHSSADSARRPGWHSFKPRSSSCRTRTRPSSRHSCPHARRSPGYRLSSAQEGTHNRTSTATVTVTSRYQRPCRLAMGT